MLSQSEHVRLPIYEASFQQSLAETIVWCTGLPIEHDPHESTEIKQRRDLGRQAGELYRRVHLSNWPEFTKKIHYRRGSKMFARARLHEIAPLEEQLRSGELKPLSFFPDPSREKCGEIVRDVVSRRAEKLRIERRSPMPTPDLADGRLLLYSPEETLDDGAARYSSKGFLDFQNAPPWDTWIGFCERYVIGWVPPQLIDLANAGVDVNPEQCVLWA